MIQTVMWCFQCFGCGEQACGTPKIISLGSISDLEAKRSPSESQQLSGPTAVSSVESKDWLQYESIRMMFFGQKKGQQCGNNSETEFG